MRISGVFILGLLPILNVGLFSHAHAASGGQCVDDYDCGEGYNCCGYDGLCYPTDVIESMCLGWSGGGGTKCTSSNCKSTSWVAKGAGYETRTYKECSGTYTCSSETQYRCAAGYYGSSSNGTSGCSKCTSPGTSPAGTTTQAGCCIPTSTTGSDTSGKYEYIDNACCYK